METPFAIGTKYWLPVLNPRQIEVICSVCYGNKTVTVTLGNGEHVAVECDACGLGYSGPRGYTNEYSYTAEVKPFTIEKVTSMHSNTWYLASAEGETSEWSTLCATEQDAVNASTQRMQEIVNENMRRSATNKKSMLARKARTVLYHEQKIKEFERQIARHRAKVSERKLVAPPRGDAMSEQRWTTDKPTQPGWYRFKNMKRREYQEPQIVKLRDYAGDLAIGNSRLTGFTLFEEGEWIGPLVPPTSPDVLVEEVVEVLKSQEGSTGLHGDIISLCVIRKAANELGINAGDNLHVVVRKEKS